MAVEVVALRMLERVLLLAALVLVDREETAIQTLPPAPQIQVVEVVDVIQTPMAMVGLELSYYVLMQH